MRDEFSTDELAAILKCHRNSTSGIIDPALRKAAKVFCEDAHRFMRLFSRYIQEEMATRASKPIRIETSEIRRKYDRLTGGHDR